MGIILHGEFARTKADILTFIRRQDGLATTLTIKPQHPFMPSSGSSKFTSILVAKLATPCLLSVGSFGALQVLDEQLRISITPFGIGSGATESQMLTMGARQEMAPDLFNAVDVSGFYWSRDCVNKVADRGNSPIYITHVGGMINRGSINRVPLHNAQRQSIFIQFWKMLNDES